MTHPKYYEAVPDDSAPDGWRTPEGMYLRLDWGDELIDINGIPHIKVSETLPYNRHQQSIPRISSALF